MLMCGWPYRLYQFFSGFSSYITAKIYYYQLITQGMCKTNSNPTPSSKAKPSLQIRTCLMPVWLCYKNPADDKQNICSFIKSNGRLGGMSWHVEWLLIKVFSSLVP